MNLIPTVNGPVREMPGFCTLPQQLTYEGPCDDAVVKLFVDRARRLPGVGRLSASRAADGFLLFRPVKGMAQEAYRLLITEEGITCEAAGQAGFSLALVTLYQLLTESPDLPCLYLEDAPRYAWRGFMLDCARHFFPVDEVKKMLEQCALLKLNRFHWHLSDDQGFRIESRRFPKLNEVGSWRAQTNGDGKPHGGFYTQDEIREVVAFAALRGIEVVPEIDLPGHTTAIIAAYPELSCTGEPLAVAEKFGILERILCAGKEAVYTFLSALLEEICPLFPSPYFHLGGDEAPKGEWAKCPDCGRAMAEHQLADCEALQAHFTGRLVEMLKAQGKTAIAWNEALASGQLDPSVVAQYWMEWGPGYSLPEAAEGRPFIMSNVENFYLDYAYAMVPMQAQLNYAPHMQGQPVPDGAQVLGLEAPLWAERLTAPEIMEAMAFPRMLSLAQRAWSTADDPDDFLAACPAYLRQLDRAKVAHGSLEEATIHGPEGMEAIIRQFAEMTQGMMAGEVTMPPEQLEAAKAFGRQFITQFMRAAYSQDEIDEVLNRMMSGLLG